MLWIMFIIGTERPVYIERPVVGAVMDSSIAWNAGVRAGDSIVTINGRPVENWESVETAFSQQEREYTLVYYRGKEKLSAVMRMERDKDSFPEDLLGGLFATLPAVVAEVLPESAAEKSGFSKGDRILSIDGKDIHSWYELVELVGKYKGDSLMSFGILREGTRMNMALKPEYDSSSGRQLIGVRVGEGTMRTVSYTPGEAVHKALDKGWKFTTMIFDVLGKLLSRRVSAKNLSGPIGIIPASGFMMLQGVSPTLKFMALIGINLAVLNLLPLIITDGGLIFFMLIEVIRKKPLSLKTQLLINRFAIAFFLALFLYISFHDVQRLPQYFRLFGK
jgi:regulator of sigma E protease